MIAEISFSLQYKGKDVFGHTYTNPRKNIGTVTKEADIKMDPKMNRRINELMKKGYNDREIKLDVVDINDPIRKTLKSRALEYRRKAFKEKVTPEEVG